MRTLALTLVPAAAFALAVGCSSSSSPSGPASGDDAGGTGSLSTVSFQMQATVPAGGEMFKCQYVQLPDFDAFMVASQHDYTPGSHHMLLYTTALTSIPAGGDQVVDCNEGAAGTSIMNNARGVLYGGQTPVGNETLPQGIGLPTKANEVLIFQVHYLNASSSDLAATVNASLTLDSNASDITTQAGLIFFYDPFIDVPPGATAKASMRCPIPSDITLLYGSSHYHARGSNYGAYLDPARDQLSTAPFYTSNSWSSPPNQQMAMKIAAGSRLRFECDYDNTGGTQEYFQGPSAQTNEMCMFIGLYYPEMGQPSDFCLSDQDMLGNGAAKCTDTLTCLQACGGKLSFGGLGGSLPPCEQKCFVQSCPTASAPLMPLLSCIKNSCATQCNGSAGSACTACVGASCGSQYTTCSSHTCN